MKKFRILKKFKEKEFINQYFNYVNKFLLKEPLSKRKLSILISIYEVRANFNDLNGKALRKFIVKKTKITEANLSTYLKEFKEKDLLLLDRNRYIFNPHLTIKNDIIEFTYKIVKDEV